MRKVDEISYGVRHRFQRKRMPSAVSDRSLTKQAFRDECDINNIMKRFERDGVLAHYNTYRGDYGDFTDCPEYHDAQNQVIAANSMFLTLPAKIRERFQNDPGAFITFVGDKRNEAEMRELGILKPLPPGEPVKPAPKGAD